MTSTQRITPILNTLPLFTHAKANTSTPLRLANLTSIDARQLLRNNISSPIHRTFIRLTLLNSTQENNLQQFMRLVAGSTQQRQWMIEDLRYVLARDTTGQTIKLLQQAIIHNVKIKFQTGFTDNNTAAEYNPSNNTVILDNRHWKESLLGTQALAQSAKGSINGSNLFNVSEYPAAIRTNQLLHELGHATVRNNATQKLRNEGNFTEEIAVDFVANDITRRVFPNIPLDVISAMYAAPAKVSANYLSYYKDNWLTRLVRFDFLDSRNLYQSDAYNVFDRLNFSAFDDLAERGKTVPVLTANGQVVKQAIRNQTTFNQLAKNQQMGLLRQLLQTSLNTATTTITPSPPKFS
jgi:hypothetical protein